MTWSGSVTPLGRRARLRSTVSNRCFSPETSDTRTHAHTHTHTHTQRERERERDRETERERERAGTFHSLTHPLPLPLQTLDDVDAISHKIQAMVAEVRAEEAKAKRVPKLKCESH